MGNRNNRKYGLFCVKISVPFGNDIPVNPVPAIQPYFSQIMNKILAGAGKQTFLFSDQPERRSMGKRDVYTSPYVADRERAAELINVNMYGGEQVVKPELLTRLRGGYPSLASISGERSRDILLEQEKPQMRYGIELETETDYGMPERVMLYDVCDYEAQIKEEDKKHRANREYDGYAEKKSRMKKTDRLIPITTLILYLGEGKWKGPRRLSEMIKHADEGNGEVRAWVQDYPILIIEADYVNPEDYTTDLKEFFLALQSRNDKQKLQKLFRTDRFQDLSRETELAIAVNLNLKTMIVKMEEEELSMCRAFEELMTEQEELGMEKGIKRGDAERMIKSVEHVIEKLKVNPAEACGIIGVTSDEFERARKTVCGELHTG